MNLLSTFILKQLNHKSYQGIVLAISGGVDSMVLLDLCYTLYQQGHIQKPTIVHVNHQLHSNAQKWADLVIQKAKDYNLRIFTEKVIIGSNAIEETARLKRYTAIFSHMKKNDVLLTAHHLDDQKETFIFRALRGTSLKGLVGIRAEHLLFGHRVIRPFYQTPKKALLTYAIDNSLVWAEDPSNKNTQYKRNEIREALTYIQDTDAFKLTQTHLIRQEYILSILVEKTLSKVLIEPHILSLKRLKEEDPAVQLELLHYWIQGFVKAIPYERTQAILKAMTSAKEDRYPAENIGSYTLQRYRHYITLLIMPNTHIDIKTTEPIINLDTIGSIINPNYDSIHITLLGNRAGQYKKKLQQLGIPSWIRAYIPFINHTIVMDTSYQWQPPQSWCFFINQSK